MSNDTDEKELSGFYRKTIDIIFAFIIGQSFLSLDPLLSATQAFFDPHNVVNLFAVFLAYFVIILGWITHHNSIVFRPHIGKLGNARYGIDLVVLFLTYYLLRISKPPDPNIQDIPYGETFLWVLPTLFFVYSVWDGIKYFEYFSNPSKKVPLDRFFLTMLFGFSFIFMGHFYYFQVISLELNRENFWENKTSIDIIYIIISIGLILAYRFRKWEVLKNKPIRL